MSGRKKRPKRRRKVASAGELIDGLLGKYSVQGDVRLKSLAQNWAKVVGPRISGRSRPSRAAGSELIVEVDNSSWMHQLNLLSEQILGKVRDFAPELGIETVRFALVRRDRPASHPDRKLHRPPPKPATKPLEPAQGQALDEIREEAETIEDEELRAIVIEARRKINR
jgi:predicted nucleic acid-binding Zn ribbon protein